METVHACKSMLRVSVVESRLPPDLWQLETSTRSISLPIELSGYSLFTKEPTMSRRTVFSVVMVLLLVSSTVSQPLQLVNAFPNLTFTQPVYLTHSNDGTNRNFVIQKNGLIKVFANDSSVASADTFLNLSSRIITGGGSSEQGLLGIAFHPNYATNGYFYVDYTQAGNGYTVIARYSVDPQNPNRALFNSELRLLTIFQPYTNHNGGILFFGLDGYLYIGMGDGGSAGDPQNRAQNLDSLLGKILRIDVDTTVGGQNYGIPPTNPFAGGGGRPEIFCYGMRNPWRVSQDPVTGDIVCGDVGQGTYEEVDLIDGGKNYGWRIMEGLHCYNPPSGCNMTGLVLPLKEYSHSGGRCSITGGFVYRGSLRPELVGRYIYADYCSGEIWKLKYGGVANEDSLLLSAGTSVLSFGTDQNNELYVLGNNGIIYRFNRNTSVSVEDYKDTSPDGFMLEQNYPNPFNPTTTITYSLQSASLVQLRVYDVLGKEVATILDGFRGPGTHKETFDASQLSSGVYLYRLSTLGFTTVKSMMLLK
jgi:Glucose / Sorbosone dehydrogenase/Secretion system C-terminal sorting domain